MTSLLTGVRTPRGFLTTIALLFVGKANAQAMMQIVHHGVASGLPGAASDLHVDDADPKSPAYYFDVTLSEPEPIRATVFGVKGMANVHLSSLLNVAHALVVVADVPGRGLERDIVDPNVAAKTLSAKLPEAKRAQVHAVSVADSDQARDMLLAVIADLVDKARANASG